MLKQSVNLKLGTSLKLTPQLKASLRLLQMSILDLELEVQQQLENNVMLERTESASDIQRTEEYANPLETNTDNEPASSDSWDDIVTSELDTDYTQSTATASSKGSSDPLANLGQTKTLSLFDHLSDQLRLDFVSTEQQLIYAYLIDALNINGLLSEPITAIFENIKPHISNLELSDVKILLTQLQACEPAGIGARDLSECLLLQLERIQNNPLMQQSTQTTQDLQRVKSKEIFSIAKKIINHLDLLAENKIQLLRRECRTSVTKLESALTLIRSLNPRPGAAFAQTENTHIIPDVVVKRQRQQWVLEINQQRLPKVHVNKEYAQCLRGTKNDELKQQLQDARFLINGLEMRQQTLVKLSQAIVARQRGFLEYGETAMQPMMMRELAKELSVHESTISRVVANKYMQTPRGTYPLRFFFSSQIKTETGDAHSATAIKGEIAKLIKTENKAKPLSDNKLAQLLKAKDIPVARRTVAKYREALGIPSTSERRIK